MNTLSKIYHIVKTNGVGFCGYRLKYALAKKAGLQKRKFSIVSWEQTKLSDWLKAGISAEEFVKGQAENGRKFFFPAGKAAGINDLYSGGAIRRGDEILKGRFTWFFRHSHDFQGDADWFLNPLTGQRAGAEKHWCEQEFFDDAVGDIKFVWELSRFAWAYSLVRAYAASGEEKYAERFWVLLDSWMKANPPNMGVNYTCGQECAIRLMAMVFAYYAFWGAACSTAERKERLLLAIAVHADRIEKNIEFAISTRTNHSLTEAAGIYTAGVLFPEFAKSERWRQRGMKILTADGRKQIFSDGGYIQQSMNYHRLMLQDMVWCFRLGRLNGETFDPKLEEKVKQAVEFLYSLQEEATGDVPNYGANDGAIILPLSSCGYRDFRPVIAAGHYLFCGERLYLTGPWEEEMAWFFGAESLKAPQKSKTRASRAFSDSGYYTLRGKESWAMMRCHSFRERPGHADMLHVDLWWKGLNLLRDSGTYQYNCGAPWQHYFRSTAAHNTVEVDGEDQMQPGGRFNWFHWTQSECTLHKEFAEESVGVMQGEHTGYERLAKGMIHRRAVVRVKDECWIVIDDLLGEGEHDVAVRWQTEDLPMSMEKNTVTVNTPYGAVQFSVAGTQEGKLERKMGSETPCEGWKSMYYGERVAAPCWVYHGTFSLPVRFVSMIRLDESVMNLRFTEEKGVSWYNGKTGKKYVLKLTPADEAKEYIAESLESDHQILHFMEAKL